MPTLPKKGLTGNINGVKITENNKDEILPVALLLRLANIHPLPDDLDQPFVLHPSEFAADGSALGTDVLGQLLSCECHYAVVTVFALHGIVEEHHELASQGLL